MTDYLHRLPSHVRPYWPFFVEAGAFYGIDPFLLAAICERESLCGMTLKPPGPTGTGDKGRGRGLMQIDERTWGEWLAKTDEAGVPLWQNPRVNILKGAEVLHLNLRYFSFDEMPAVAAYNAGPVRVRKALAELTKPAAYEARLAAADSVTTGGNYASDCLARRAALYLAVEGKPYA